MSDRLLTAAQVAELIGMRTDYIYALTRREQIPHLRFGRTLRFRRESIDAWIQTVERGTVVAPKKWPGGAATPPARQRR